MLSDAVAASKLPKDVANDGSAAVQCLLRHPLSSEQLSVLEWSMSYAARTLGARYLTEADFSSLVEGYKELSNDRKLVVIRVIGSLAGSVGVAVEEFLLAEAGREGDEQVSSAAMRALSGLPMLSRRTMDALWRMYLRIPDPADDGDRSSRLRAAQAGIRTVLLRRAPRNEIIETAKKHQSMAHVRLLMVGAADGDVDLLVSLCADAEVDIRAEALLQFRAIPPEDKIMAVLEGAIDSSCREERAAVLSVIEGWLGAHKSFKSRGISWLQRLSEDVDSGLAAQAASILRGYR
jgi:hypothetical protein